MIGLDTLIFLVVLIFSVVIHEVSHGVVADHYGDPTARLSGRLTLNPVSHIDPFGSVLLPGLLILLGSPIIFGAAKPVPVNVFNLRSPKRHMALVALAGPVSNLVLAAACAIPLRFGFIELSSPGGGFLFQVVVLNLVLAVFNLIPIPPLDGSKILAGVLSDRYVPVLMSLERYGFLLIILFLFLGLFQLVLIPILNILLKLFIGATLF